MIPSALVAQLQQGMKDFLRASFWATTEGFEEMLGRFVEGEDEGEHPLFRGPFVSLKLPFEVGEVGPGFFEKVPMEFPPYRHQERAFQRLGGPVKENTLVATGTGSGKTECFLYPVLAHCEATHHLRGVKAILIYPMNALAQDQAERFAAMIHSNPNLRGKIRAGLYVGSKQETPQAMMGETSVITDKDVLRENPPDILLTNYKMLDYLMVRPSDQVIWAKNGPETLQFLVVDELHTFDGAQGSDLASLLRRLKARLKTPEGHLTCVGTSATMGDGEQSVQNLLRYAREVFGESFDEDSVIRETLQSKDYFVDAGLEKGADEAEEIGEAVEIVPGAEVVDDLDATRFQDPQAYVERQQEIWFGEVRDPVSLGVELRGHFLLERLLFFTRQGPQSVDELVVRLQREAAFRDVPARRVRLSLLSFLSLVAYARDLTGKRSFLQLRLELWQREMRRMVATVEEKPRLLFHDDLTRDQRKVCLPVIYCRECGTMGWATMVENDKPLNLSVGLQGLYRGYFQRDPRVTFFFPAETELRGDPWFVQTRSLRRSREAPEEPEDPLLEGPGPVLDVVFTENTRKSDRGLVSHHDCPACEAKESLSLLGFQAASLTSAYINQLFASRFNDDKKLLTFSDSVQDAAHRAGFFEGRTWRFNLRLAIQEVVELAGGDVALGALPEMVADHWEEKLGPEAFVATFLAPDMAWLRDYEKLKTDGKLPAKSDLLRLIRRRLSWEVIGEYSLRAPIGRTLPRTGASIAYVDPARVDEALSTMVEPIRNEIGGLQEVGVEELRPLVMGLLRRLLTQGAVFQPELHKSYLETGGENTFVMGRQRHMPGISPKSRLPVFLASRRTRRFEPVSKRSGETWYDRWFGRCVGEVTSLVADEARYAYEQVILERLVAAGVLEGRMYGGTRVWGLSLDALRVTREVAVLEEEATGRLVQVARAEREVWLRTPAMGTRGGGYRESLDSHEGYYARLYRGGEVKRIVADEHTGLLDRDVREAVEQRFKSEEPEPWYPNLLSCTPTLEMGIDVGSLSAAVLCSVPPAQSNYLQRIGRAGRRDGNSLLLTFAAARAHDLYFFAEPEEMIGGDVDVPGVFLNASAVLERQLTAFCFDRWAASGVDQRDLPRMIGTVLERLGKGDDAYFPRNLLRYVEDHSEEILQDFLGLFEDHLTEPSRESLVHFMRGDDEEVLALNLRLLEAFEGAEKELKRETDEHRRTKRRLEKLQAEEVLGEDQKKEIEGMEQELAALGGLIVRLKKRDTMEFLTTSGLLPNYTFPEAGVMLKSVIWRKKEAHEGGKGKYETVSYEYERPARSAIRELAPRSRFYAGGRQVEIDRVGVDRGDIETWQFCDVCHFCARVTVKHDAERCPSCGSEGFGNVAGQVHKMLKLRQVYANTNDRESRIGDDRDERPPSFFQQKLLVTAQRGGVDAWAIDDEKVKFGYEYVPRTGFREVNFGEYRDVGEVGQKGLIAGDEAVRDGFAICADCGKIQPRSVGDKPVEGEHTFGCPSRRRNHRERIEQCLFLYRDFEAEAIHILLPFANRPGFEKKLHSFVAAFQMGLKAYFGGKVDHLEATSLMDPPRDGSGSKLFLVLYDRIPGGTGYLKDLMLPAEDGSSKIMAILEVALAILTGCSCRMDLEKDGCYRCLFAYRNSYDMSETSRKVAEEVLREILAEKEKLAPQESLGSIIMSALYDSELEARFVEALGEMRGVKRKKALVRQRTGHRLHVMEPGERSWEMVPQVNRGEREGLACKVSIDFLIEGSGDQGRSVAVFTDGFQYHWDRVGRDLFQRMALVQSGQAYTWSLSYQDVESQFAAQESWYFELISSSRSAIGEAFFGSMYDVFGEEVAKRGTGGEPSWEWLEWYVRAGAEQGERELRALAMSAVASLMDPQRSAGAYAEWCEELKAHSPQALQEVLMPELTGEPMHAMVEGPEGSTGVKLFASFERRAMTERNPGGIRVLLWFDDSEEAREQSGYQRTWNGVLRLYNLLQFLPETFFVTANSMEELDFRALLESRPRLPEGEGDLMEWEALRAEVVFLGPEYGVLVDRLFEAGCVPGVAGYVINEDGRPVSGPAEIAWEEEKVALLDMPEGDFGVIETREDFESRGWRVVDVDEAVDDPGLVIELLTS